MCIPCWLQAVWNGLNKARRFRYNEYEYNRGYTSNDGYRDENIGNIRYNNATAAAATWGAIYFSTGIRTKERKVTERVVSDSSLPRIMR